MTGLDDNLSSIISLATEILAEGSGAQTRSPDGAIRYALLTYLEDRTDLPVMVKYGDAGRSRETLGIEDDDVWAAVPSGNYTLFRIEQEEPFSHGDRSVLDRTMLAIGAWYVGSAGIRGDENWTHHLYVWPDDHPVVQMLDGD